MSNRQRRSLGDYSLGPRSYAAFDESTELPKSSIETPEKFLFLYEPHQFKCLRGGRGSAKSWQIARALVAQAFTQKHLVLCTRQFQSSTADSAKRTIEGQIERLGLQSWFKSTLTTIVCTLTGSEFIFKGLLRNTSEIKSLEGVTRCWVEEAESVTDESWLVLEPTIRAPGSELWVSYNPLNEQDATNRRYYLDKPPGCVTVTVSWRDNPWFPAESEAQRVWMLDRDSVAYEWVWEGAYQQISAATIYAGCFEIKDFDTPEDVHLMFGADWGFAVDPTVLVRCFIKDDCLYVDYEAYGLGVELDDIEFLFAGGASTRSGLVYPGIPGARVWPIKADNARPETISYMKGKGFDITPATKWNGSVQDGIAHVKGFKRIYVHPRCTYTAQEFRLYSYKVDARDRKTILPIVVDRHNHTMDSIRYSLDGHIVAGDVMGAWMRMANAM